MYAIDKDRVFWRKVDGETVILDIESGCYFTLDTVGALIWEMIVRGRQMEEIVEGVESEFDVDRAQAARDVKQLIKSLEKEEIIKISTKK